ncbi:MAG: hypothetical protein AB7L92_07970, partial [Alphaproteobacteria bacterium]
MTSLDKLPDTIIRAVRDEALAYQCAQRGHFTSRHYSHMAFKHAWLQQLALFLGRAPEHA